jgi:shikimate kinase
MARNIVLTGFMGAGKTTVGRLLAQTLGWAFIDLDERIVRETGSSIGDLFRDRGEAAFRAIEARLTGGLSSVDRTVIAPGGGWIIDPANSERLPPATCTVWLRVSAEEAVRRIRDTASARPLLANTADPVTAADALMQRRRDRYATADIVIDVDGRTPADIVAEIRSRIRFEG